MSLEYPLEIYAVGDDVAYNKHLLYIEIDTYYVSKKEDESSIAARVQANYLNYVIYFLATFYMRRKFPAKT